MKKGSGIPAIDNHIRIPEGIYQQLIDRVEQTKCRSVNRMIVNLLVKALEMEESQKRELA
jgi:hypothetical protein